MSLKTWRATYYATPSREVLSIWRLYDKSNPDPMIIELEQAELEQAELEREQKAKRTKKASHV